MELSFQDKEKLVLYAVNARKNAYAPYSQYMVGAAAMTSDGSIFTGCNVENASYGLTSCAERNTVYEAVSKGYKKIKAIAIHGKQYNAQGLNFDFPYPCGACLQVLAEFVDDEEDMLVIVAKSANVYQEYKLSELLPETFKLIHH